MARDLGIVPVSDGKFYFISYNSEDADRVSEYVNEIVDQGLRIWYDRGIKTGMLWEEEITQKIADSKAIIMFITNQIFIKDQSYVYKEFKIAQMCKKSIFLILLDEIIPDDIPNKYKAWWVDIEELQGIEARKFKNVHKCIELLKKAMHEEIDDFFSKPKIQITSDENGMTRIKYQDNSEYYGEIKNNKRHGKGKLTTRKGVYEGEFKNNIFCGYGIYTYKDGSKYEGEWDNGKRNGQGKFSTSSGEIYEGTWKNNFIIEGTHTNKKGYEYRGNFERCKYSGYGIRKYKNGSKYEGEWAYGRRMGKGIFYSSNDRTTYEGEWKFDKKEGKGKLTFENGDIYEGNFKDDKFDGHGIYMYSSGGKYEGEWAVGKRKGYGIYISATGDIFEGNWIDGKMNGTGKVIYKNGNKYEGEFKEDKFDGFGIYTYKNGSKYEGEWTNGKKVGK